MFQRKEVRKLARREYHPFATYLFLFDLCQSFRVLKLDPFRCDKHKETFPQENLLQETGIFSAHESHSPPADTHKGCPCSDMNASGKYRRQAVHEFVAMNDSPCPPRLSPSLHQGCASLLPTPTHGGNECLPNGRAFGTVF